MSHQVRLIAAILVCVLQANCGVVVPTIAEPWEPTYPGIADPTRPTPPVTASGQLEYEIKKTIYCELWFAVRDADQYKVDVKKNGVIYTSKLVPDEWGVQISLFLEVDDNSALSPTATFITPLSAAQNRSLGIGANLSSTATRIDKFNNYFTVKYLRSNDAENEICRLPEKDAFLSSPQHFEPSRSSLMVNNLGIRDWLIDSQYVNRSIPSFGTPSTPSAIPQSPTPLPGTGGDKKGDAKGGKKPSDAGLGQEDAISLEVKFIVTTSGNLNPALKLTRVTADSGANPLLSAGRTRTHDMILTIGPRTPATDYANLALQIGQAVSGGNRAALLPRQ